MSVFTKLALLAGCLALLLVSSAQARWVYQGTVDDFGACLFAMIEASDEIVRSDTDAMHAFGACMGGKGYIVPDDPSALEQYIYRHTDADGATCTYDTLQIHPQASPTQNPWTLRQSGEEIDPDYWRWISLCMRGKGYRWVPPQD